jgi:hypothetical protein
MTQHGSWSGKLSVDGRNFDLAQDTWWGSRDHSWGVRNVGGRDPRGAPPEGEPQFFWNWAPLNFDDLCTLYTVSENADGSRWHQSGVMLTPYPDATAMECDVDHQHTFQKGTRWASHAVITLRPQKGPELEIELTPLYNFLMKGIGYGDPKWGHGMWVGPDEAEGVVYDLSQEEPMANLHIQAIVTARAGRREGVGILEQIVLGPHAKYGFTGLMDAAK